MHTEVRGGFGRPSPIEGNFWWQILLQEQKEEEEEEHEQRRTKKETKSLGDDRSQGGNGLFHLIHVSSGELEHRKDRGLVGELKFPQGVVSSLHLNQQQSH